MSVYRTAIYEKTFMYSKAATLYGMNFEYMPELGWRYGYFLIWAFMLLVSLLLVLYFRQRKWL